MHRLYLLGVEADFICSCQRRFDPLVSNQARQNVPQHVDTGLWTQTHFPGHPAVGDQHLQSEAHDVRQIPGQTKKKIILTQKYEYICLQRILSLERVLPRIRNIATSSEESAPRSVKSDFRNLTWAVRRQNPSGSFLRLWKNSSANLTTGFSA